MGTRKLILAVILFQETLYVIPQWLSVTCIPGINEQSLVWLRAGKPWDWGGHSEPQSLWHLWLSMELRTVMHEPECPVSMRHWPTGMLKPGPERLWSLGLAHLAFGSHASLFVVGLMLFLSCFSKSQFPHLRAKSDKPLASLSSGWCNSCSCIY